MVYFIANNHTPIPYSNRWIEGKWNGDGTPLKNILPAPGSLVCFMFDSNYASQLSSKSAGQIKGTISITDGTAAASMVSGQGKTIAIDKVNGNKTVNVIKGMAPDAKILPIRQGFGHNDGFGKALAYATEGLDGIHRMENLIRDTIRLRE
jgi:hypothetical protein